MPAVFLEANTFSVIDDKVGTKGTVDGTKYHITGAFNSEPVSPANHYQATAPNPGKVVGLIYFCTTNDSANAHDFVFNKNGTDMALKVTIPAGQTGIFYSSPDIAEASRTFAASDIIDVRLRKNGDGTSPGTDSDATLMIAIEIELV